MKRSFGQLFAAVALASAPALADTIQAQAAAIADEFALSAEYVGRNRTNAQYVGDLYNAFLRRGGDLNGANFWIGRLDTQANTRAQLRGFFAGSGEFMGRAQKVSNACVK